MWRDTCARTASGCCPKEEEEEEGEERLTKGHIIVLGHSPMLPASLKKFVSIGDG